MTDTIRLGAFLLPSAGATIAQYERGFAGQNPNFYQNTLRDSARLIRQLDDIGFDFVAFSEHHFHLEGLELSNNPILLGSWAAGLTRKLRIGQMGNVLPARNPLLMAEDLAMLDHFSEGRMMAGFARGYQARHVATIGQKYNAWSTAANDPRYQEHDRTNRELFAEHYDIIRRAWREPLFRHEGQHWQLPPPGIPWNHPATLAMAPGMVGADGMLHQIGIAPMTLQDPATIETYTVRRDNGRPTGVIIGRLTADDTRFLATTEDDELVSLLIDGDPLGQPVRVRPFDYGNRCTLV